ncbi:glycosyltransferase family 4 protein [Pseudoalteromonas sp. meg-B1]|jgi:glycosyltransferase involved in cell wall biosynthesis|uniref:glycosyltransferase family 4 protein n=1 Tax=Pseudoalteromonas sp. meg-B1 TaxID=2203192 RepID=UPI0015E862C4|nr:glycosyltransferase family 4 protein [Pseudoalteromonas sp. meg-B1]
MSNKIRVAHLTSVHGRFDIRIFRKMLTSLAGKYNASLIVADGEGDNTTDNIDIFDVGLPTNRLSRMFKTVRKIYDKALELNAEIYHIHDPELIPIGMKLKKKGKVVIFDAHEDLPKQLRSKPYLNKALKWLLPKLFEVYEAIACKKLDAIICATPSIHNKFLKINKQSYTINNFPILGELDNSLGWSNKVNEICYVGGMAEIRGIRELVHSLKYLDNCRLHLVGRFSEPELEKELKGLTQWTKVVEHGFVDRKGVADILSRCKAGVVTFHKVPNHVDAQPNKMFEYMSAGVPVIASHFPMWKDIIEGENCGICVDPMKPEDIANAINKLLSDDKLAKQMSENGANAVKNVFNWENEEIKLLDIYQGFLEK